MSKKKTEKKQKPPEFPETIFVTIDAEGFLAWTDVNASETDGDRIAIYGPQRTGTLRLTSEFEAD